MALNITRYAEDFFACNRLILECGGLWMPKQYRNNKIRKLLYQIYAVFLFIFAGIWFTTTELLSMFSTYTNEHAVLKTLSFLLTHYMGCVKGVFWFFFGHKMISILDILEAKHLRYEGYGDFQPGGISVKYKNIGQKYSFIHLGSAHASLFSSYLPPAFNAIKYLGRNDEFPQEKFQNLPFHSLMPFNYHTTPVRYLMGLGYQIAAQFSLAYYIVGMDTLFMNIMNCVACNLTIIQGAFTTIRERSIIRIHGNIAEENDLINSEKLNEEMNRDMKKVCKHLEVMLQVCKDLEKIYKFVTLAQATATLFILCSCLYLVSTAPIGNKQFYAEAIYLIGMYYQIILYCWFGNQVTLKAEEMPVHIWKSNWINTDRSFKRAMVLTMIRLTKPVYLTAGNFAPLTLTTFMAIIKTSYSVFTLIKNTTED